MNALTLNTKSAYNGLALAKSSVEISLSQPQGDTNTPKTVVNCVYFCVCNLSSTGQLYLFMVGCIGATSVAPLPWGGKANPVQLATPRLASEGGVSKHLPKESQMTNQITLNPSEIISTQNNGLTTTSLQVAEVFKKRHDNILRRIDEIIAQTPEEFYRLNFEEVEIEQKSNLKKGTYKTRAFKLTKDGFILVVMGFTGKLAMQIKIAYIDAFNFMADKLYGEQPKLESPYIADEQLDHIKQGVGKMVHATGKHWQAVYRELFDYVGAPSVREIKKERYLMACDFLGISPDFEVPADKMALPKLPAGHMNMPFDMRKNADYTIQVRNGKISRKRLMYCIDPQDERQPWWLEA